MKLIDKSAVVAEIEKRKNICEKVILDLRTQENKAYYHGKAQVYGEVLDYLNTLEVKEVDLEKEMNDYFVSMEVQENENIFESTFRLIAKHFFELGLKAQKGE